MFKKGDRVIRVKDYDYDSAIKKGNIYTISDINVYGLRLKEVDHNTYGEFTKDAFELVETANDLQELINQANLGLEALQKIVANPDHFYNPNLMYIHPEGKAEKISVAFVFPHRIPAKLVLKPETMEYKNLTVTKEEAKELSKLINDFLGEE